MMILQGLLKLLETVRNNMERLCIEAFGKDGMCFVKGCSYNVNYNTYDGRIYIYDCRGFYTDISKETLNRFFL